MTATGIRARGLGVRVAGDRDVLRAVSLSVAPGSMLVIAGASGSGKTTLLEVLAGVRPPDEGSVTHAGAPPMPRSGGLGFVPQDDIVHRDLPLARTLRYAAELRLPAGTPADEVAAAVRQALDDLGLAAVAGQRVGTLSGGERKRASIAVELLTRPRVLFLDEPTSGLDPATGAALLKLLRGLAHQGTTIVLTTHTPADVLRADLVAFLAPEGRLVYRGAPDGLLKRLGAETIEEAYGAAADAPSIADTPDGPDLRDEEAVAVTDHAGRFSESHPKSLGPLRQWWLLTRRSAEILARNRLSAAVLVGSPVVIIAMFAMLFRPGAFDAAAPDPASTAMICFWIAFGAFFFGLTYGLLQICTELPIVRRERLTVLRLGPYLAAKAAILLPVLVAADALLLGVLRVLHRLPAAGWNVYGSLFVSAVLASAAALALGLLASAAVAEPGQATLMLPLLCFPQVLFSGAFVPVPRMSAAGSGLSWAMTNRWAFEALGSGVGLDALWAHGASPMGPPQLASYGDTFAHPSSRGWLWLAGFTVLFLAAAWAVLARKCRRVAR
ncbi:MAG: ATP-binding cassette domain-containing protein [Catenulisporales bacterium]|nr:ATP-binding cassette domain-containing protein [Catenulisporales bacterium]